ncbi:MAG: DUF1428 domain-containing protein [Proteobacteria bacterium]|nr:DUF1428 domain-containing protein [Pseudomonadota bacterium]
MNYVHGFVAAVPTANKEAYIKFTRNTGAVLKRLGAVQAVECWGVDVPEGKVTSFPMAVKCKADETVVFSWTLWKSKDDANKAEAKMRAGEIPEFDFKNNPPPFDGKRLIYGGFEVVVETGSNSDDGAFIGGFVAAVPTAKKAEFIKHCKSTDEAVLKLGAVQVVECWGVDVPDGEVTSFPMAVQKKPDETVVFSWIRWRSKADAKKAESNEMPELNPETNPLPLDGSRVIFGGFEMVVNI